MPVRNLNPRGLSLRSSTSRQASQMVVCDFVDWWNSYSPAILASRRTFCIGPCRAPALITIFQASGPTETGRYNLSLVSRHRGSEEELL